MYLRCFRNSPGDKSHCYCTVTLHVHYAEIFQCLYSQTLYPPKSSLIFIETLPKRAACHLTFPPQSLYPFKVGACCALTCKTKLKK